jgi:hypothetical protein
MWIGNWAAAAEGARGGNRQRRGRRRGCSGIGQQGIEQRLLWGYAAAGRLTEMLGRGATGDGQRAKGHEQRVAGGERRSTKPQGRKGRYGQEVMRCGARSDSPGGSPTGGLLAPRPLCAQATHIVRLPCALAPSRPCAPLPLRAFMSWMRGVVMDRPQKAVPLAAPAVPDEPVPAAYRPAARSIPSVDAS